MRKRHVTTIIAIAISLTLLTSCLSLVPENGSTASVKEITELSEILAGNPDLLSEVSGNKSLTEPVDGSSTENVVVEDTEVSADESIQNTTVYEDTTSSVANSEPSALSSPSEEKIIVDTSSSDTVVITGTSILENNTNTGFTSAPDSWMPAQDMSDNAQKIDPAVFVSAEELPLEVAGKDISNTSTVTPEKMNIIWEDEVYTPDVVVSSGPADISNERDILKEYEQFVADLGDDYTVAKSDDITLEELLAVSEQNSSDGKNTENNLYEDENSDNTWTEVPSESSESSESTTETEGKKAGITGFFKGIWSDIKTLAVNLGSTVKGWFVKK